MENIKEQLTADMKEAMKAKDTIRLNTIRMVRGAIKQQEIDGKKELTNDDVIAVISKELKMRRDSLEEFTKAGRTDLVEKTQAEIGVLTPYLPAQLTEDEIKAIVKEAIETTGAASPKDMGKVMGAIMPKVKGKADGKLVNIIVKGMLA